MPRRHVPDDQEVSLSPDKNYEDLQASVQQREHQRKHYQGSFGGDTANQSRHFIGDASSHSRRIVSTETEQCLDWLHKHCFREVIHIERSLEDQKKELARRGDFSLEAAFALFGASHMSTRLTKSELLSGFEKLGITAEEADAKLVVMRYDADEDGKLGFWEFANIFMPIDAMVRDDLERRQSRGDLSSDTRQ